jgi:beta-N-acetylhexosaminidase
MKYFSRILRLLLFLALFFSSSAGLATPELAAENYIDTAQDLLNNLTPEERVGQLFLVTFQGVEGGPRSEIYQLIAKYHVGGVILRSDNDNFLAHDQTVPFTQDLTRQLQNHSYAASQVERTNPVTNEQSRSPYIPLFIGISQEGNGFPYDQILSNAFTHLPSQMAIGATWQPDLARQVGTVLGSELSALGANMLLGPSLDVLEFPHTEGSSDMGVRTFGGDPFWVGEMGREFIIGVHQGSNNEIAVVAKHFPGYGSSDRLPEEEVATVRKSLEQLKQVELAPFFAVTGNAVTPEATADALLTSHIRYQGFQGNIRYSTKPVSFDRSALNDLMSLPQFSSWRSNGGVMITDDLGSRAVRRFYEFFGQSFIGRYVARDAFLAGNDLLYLGNMQSSESPESHAAIIRTIEFFNQRYQEDPIFAQRVDESVLRILALKYRLYDGSFSITKTLPPQEVPSSVGNSSNISFEVLRQAATLIWPTQAELANTMPEPPGRDDQIVFITDVRYSRQCSRCPLRTMINEKALEDAILRLYSPVVGGPIFSRNLVSYTFDNLQEMLDVGTGVVQIENDIRHARWIVFIMSNENPNIPSSQALRRFLDKRIDLLQQKKIIVFALDAPYYLDATDISKLTAYYALYSRTPRSIDIAARLLMQDISANGFSPISVQSIGYDLTLATQPDPAQLITLALDVPVVDGQNQPTTIPPGSISQLRQGDTIPIKTGPILDQNGHRVPDNTIVRFVITRGDGIASATIEAPTVRGVAKTVVRVEGDGMLQIRAESERARNSEILQFEVPSEIEPVSPTPEPTQTPTLTPTLVPTVTPTPTEAVEVIPLEEPRHILFSDWLIATFVTLGIGLSAYWIALSAGQIRWGLRSGLLALIGGLVSYAYLALDLPGSPTIIQNNGGIGVLTITLLGAVLGGAIAWGWKGLLYLKKD